MKSYRKISIFENKRRLEALSLFRNNIVEYFNNCEPNGFLRDFIENQTASNLRPEINRTMAEAIRIVRSSGVSTFFDIMRAPAAGGGTYPFDVINGVFNLSYHQIDPRYVIDLLDRSIGVYAQDQKKSLLRTVNPFWWVWQLVEWISSIPFAIISAAGLERYPIESSVIGRIVKMLIQGAIAALTFLQIDAILNDSRVTNQIKIILFTETN